jgi:hypothetical protein
MASTVQPGAGNSSSTASKQQLSVWGLPQPILESFHKKGLKQLYPWQAAALDCAAAGNNLVYCAPTSGAYILSKATACIPNTHTIIMAGTSFLFDGLAAAKDQEVLVQALS